VLDTHLVSTVPIGYYAGLVLIGLGFIALDWRGVFLGVLVAGMTVASTAYHRRRTTPAPLDD
jgi:hypothetical protein